MHHSMHRGSMARAASAPPMSATSQPASRTSVATLAQKLGVSRGTVSNRVTKLEDAGIIVCAWGQHGEHMRQDQTALGWIDLHNINDARVYALGFTKNKQPKHPLYLKGSTLPIPWRPKE